MKRYTFVEINRYYYCLQQNPFSLAWFLYFRNKSLSVRFHFQHRTVSRTIKLFIQYRLRLRKPSSVIDLPIFGNVCIQVHRGYKIFNYSERRVIRMMDVDVPEAFVIKEINRVKRAGGFKFAPEVLDSSVDNRWYVEEFVNGYIGFKILRSHPQALLGMYEQDIAPCIEQMILHDPPTKRTVGSIADLGQKILDDEQLSGLDDGEKVFEVRQFVRHIMDHLSPQKQQIVYLVFSHGDFSLRNMVYTKKGLMVIDWEDVGSRSVLFDLYNFFLTELYYKRVSTNLVSEIEIALESLQRRLKTSRPEIAYSLAESADIYRRLYYIERVSMLMNRHIDNELLGVIWRSIAVFETFEKDFFHSNHARVDEL